MPGILGLNAKPFSFAPDTEFMVPLRPHKLVRDTLTNAIDRSPTIALVTGDWGIGKTLVARSILDLYQNQDSARTECPKSFSDPPVNSIADLVLWIQGNQIGSTAAWGTVASALEQAKSQNTRIILIVDEAQALSSSNVKDLAVLAESSVKINLDLHILLFGQTEFQMTLKLSTFTMLNSLITLKLHIDELSRSETKAFITERLRLAGAADPIFSDGAVQLIAKACRGNPRRIIKLCNILLFLAKGRSLLFIDEKFTRQALINNVSPESMSLTNAVAEPEKGELAPVAPLPLDDGEPVNRDPRIAPAVDASLEKVYVTAPHERIDTATSLSTPEGTTLQGLRNWIRPVFGVAIAAGLTGILLVNLPMFRSDALSPLTRNSAPLPMGGEIAASKEVANVATEDRVDIPSTSVASKFIAPDVLPVASGTHQGGQSDFLKGIRSDNPQQAAILLSLAAVQGHRRAATFLGQLYATGDGVVFSPTLADRWFAVAAGESNFSSLFATGDAQVSMPSAKPLFARMSGEKLDLVWNGAADSFRVELADADGDVIGYLVTPLTVARIDFPTGAAAWRVRADSLPFSAWLQIED